MHRKSMMALHLPGLEHKAMAFDAPKEIGLGEVKDIVTDMKKSFEVYKEKNDAALADLAQKGSSDVVTVEELDKINKHLDTLQEQSDKFIAQQKRRSLYSSAGNQLSPAEMDKKALDWAKMAGKERQEIISDYTDADLTQYKMAFDRALRKDQISLTDDEKKSLSVGTDPDGGYVVYPDMNGRIVGRIFESSPVRQYASVTAISSDALEGLRDDDEADSGWVSEKGSRTETGTPELARWRIQVHEQYAAPRITQKLLDDAAIDMEAWLSGKVANKFTRVENAAFVNGDGSGQPRGFLTYPDYASAGVYEVGAIERFKTGVNGGFAASPNGGDVLIDAVYGLKAEYRASGVWFMNRTTTAAVRKLKNTDGDYLWQPGIQAGQPATILGYAMASYEDMPDFNATGALAIAFGDMGETYQIVDRTGMRVLRDPYTVKPFIELYTTKRTGGDVINFDSLKLIEFSA